MIDRDDILKRSDEYRIVMDLGPVFDTFAPDVAVEVAQRIKYELGITDPERLRVEKRPVDGGEWTAVES